MTASAVVPALEHLQPALHWIQQPVPEVLTAEWITAQYDELLAACRAAGDDIDAWLNVIAWRSELESVLVSRMGRAGIAYRLDTTDEAATTEYQRVNRELSPVVSDASLEVARQLVAAPAVVRAAITEKFGPLLLQQEDAQVRTNDPAVTPLRTELSDVLMQYTKVFGTAKITWRGEEYPFSYARKAALDPDADERHAAWQSKVAYVRQHEAELNTIFDEAHGYREQIASELGFSSYVEMRYLEMGRFDYTPSEVAQVRAAILEHLVPLVTKQHARQAAALGTALVHPADEAIHPEPAAELIVPVEEQLEAGRAVFHAMGTDFAQPWDMLLAEQLIDLPAREGKGTGAFCATLPAERVPYLFCNSVGTFDDVKTLVHEFGHAMQSWRSRTIEPFQLRSPTAESCEIHSMALELICHPWMEAFFGDTADLFRAEHLRSTLEVMPYMAAIDEFQHRVYDERLDAHGRSEAWREIAEKYMPGIDWSADEWYAHNRWMMQLHVYQYPFYYIDYALARLVSWELWLDWLDDREAGTQRYLDLCSAGGTKPFRELVTDAGLGDPFDEQVIARTMQRLAAHL